VFATDASCLEHPFTGPQLVVFLGRMTHQKGCDTIAMAASFFLKHCHNVSV
jgi:glycogen synthase